MKKTNTQFVVVFVGVLILHLAVTTALMKSAHTDGSGLSIASPDPYYHSSPDKPEQSPGWNAAESPNTPQNSIEPPGNSGEAETPKSIPDAFETATQSAESSPEDRSGASPKTPPVSAPRPAPEKIEPAPAAPVRRLTMTQLLTPNPPVASGASKKDAATTESTETASGPKVKPLPPVTESNSGPRKIRSLSGN